MALAPSTRWPDHHIITSKGFENEPHSLLRYRHRFCCPVCRSGHGCPIVNGEIYPAEAVAQTSTTTRAQVKAELADAQRAGYVAARGDVPTQFATESSARTAGKSRAEVRAELAEAQRTGTVLNYHGA